MKLFYVLFVLASTLFAASIDTKLYDEQQRDAYYEVIKQELELAEKKGLRSKELIQEEKSQLSKLYEASDKKVAIDKYDLTSLDAKSINVQTFYETIVTLSNIQYKQEENSRILEGIHLKILSLKQSIERMVEEEKEKLLSYQFQFAYYKIQQKNIELKKTLLIEDEENIKIVLLENIHKLECDPTKVFDKELSSAQNSASENQKAKLQKELERDKAIIEGSETVDLINKKIQVLDSSYQEAITQSIVLNMEKLLCLLKDKDSTGFYKLMSDLQDIVKDISNESQKALFLKQIVILKDVSKVELGRTTLFVGATLEETKNVFLQIQKFLLSPLFIFSEQAISFFDLFMAFFYVFIGFFLGGFYKKRVAQITSKFKDISMMSVRLISNIGYYLIVLVFIIISFSSLGINMTSLSLIAGALSIGIGFGLQTVVSNLIAGIILMFERTIRIGDIIEINDVVSGVVTDMRIRSTTVKTFDNIDVVVPNSSFVQNNVINMTLEDRVRRIHIPFGVAYGTEVEDVRKAVLEALDASKLYYIKSNPDRAPSVRMTMMNSSSVDMELVVWVNRDIQMKFISIDSDFLILIYDALRANDISIPFPQLDVYMKEMIENTQTGSKT